MPRKNEWVKGASGIYLTAGNFSEQGLEYGVRTSIPKIDLWHFLGAFAPMVFSDPIPPADIPPEYIVLMTQKESPNGFSGHVEIRDDKYPISRAYNTSLNLLGLVSNALYELKETKQRVGPVKPKNLAVVLTEEMIRSKNHSDRTEISQFFENEVTNNLQFMQRA